MFMPSLGSLKNAVGQGSLAQRSSLASLVMYCKSQHQCSCTCYCVNGCGSSQRYGYMITQAEQLPEDIFTNAKSMKRIGILKSSILFV